MKEKKIGILIQKCDSIFTNGCFQQAYFTYKCLKKTGYDIVMLTADDGYEKYPFLDIDIRYITMETGLDDICTIIFTSAFASEKKYLEAFKSKGIKIVNQIGGNYFILTQEAIIFDKHNKEFFIGNELIDEVWLLPMYEFMKEYLYVLSKRPIKIVPYVWDNEIIDLYCNINNIDPIYRVSNKGKVSTLVMEPNMSIHKTCLLPLVMINGFNDRHPDKLQSVLCLCAPESSQFKKFIGNLGIHQQGKVQTYPRLIMPEVIRQIQAWDSKPILVSHQILNDLNFLPMEMMYYGYPVVHNCKPYEKLGYYYKEHNALQGVECIEMACVHDKCFERYLKDSRRELYRYNPYNQENIKVYQRLLDDLSKDTEIPKIQKNNKNNDGKFIFSDGKFVFK